MIKNTALGLFLLLVSTVVVANVDTYLGHEAASAFMSEMSEEHDFSRQELESWFTSATKKQSILDAISRPAEKTLTWEKYRKIFLTSTRIKQGIIFWQNNQEILAKAEQEFGIPPEIIVAIIGVETLYGKRQGSFRVIDALSTLAFDYPPRSRFFRKELKEFLLLAREQKQDPLSLSGSYAGAMGYGQFIPSSYRAYAIDYDGDGFADIWRNEKDAIGSVANYFKRHGWKTGEEVAVRSRLNKNHDKSLINQSLKPSTNIANLKSRGFLPTKPVNDGHSATIMRLEGSWGEEFWLGLHNFYVITRYNHSRLYAMAVWQLSQEILAEKSSS